VFDFLEMRIHVPAMAFAWLASSQFSKSTGAGKSRPSDGVGAGDDEGVDAVNDVVGEAGFLAVLDRGLRGMVRSEAWPGVGVMTPAARNTVEGY
jgi:hypothetical protein